MKIIYGGRCSGKTTRLIEESHKDGGYIVCMSKRECSRIFHMAKEMKLSIPFPMTYMELCEGDFYGKGIESFHIDNVEYFLYWMCKEVSLKTITFTPFGSIEKLEIPEKVREEFEKKMDG